MKLINRIKVTLTAIVVFICLAFTHGQDGVRLHDERAMDGYTLYQSGNSAALINNCGNLIHEWTQVSAQYHPKLLPNGNIVYIEVFSRNIIEKDWNDNLINEIVIDAFDINLNYEVIVLPNGNYLCIARRSFSQSQFIDIGYSYGWPVAGETVGRPTQYDMVVEVERSTGNIVWEWNIIDHAIQGRDASKGNFGVVADHPELLDMDAIGIYDWTDQESFMINGFDYNPDLDQIALSVRKMSEVVIIDHSTTTAEAAGHTGGNSGKGGDILYRWGNPQNYGRGSSSDRFLYFQHNPNWIKDGPHKGKLVMYNNGLNRPNTSSSDDYSAIPIIDTGVDANGNYTLPDSAPYGPVVPDENYSKVTTGNDFYSGYTSAGKVLANGNILVTVGGSDRTFEMLPEDGTVVWSYGLVNAGLTFRVEKYALDYPAFEGRDLTPGDVLEFPPSNVNCTLVDVVDSYFDNTNVWSKNDKVMINTDIASELDVSIYSVDGKLHRKDKVMSESTIDISSLLDGIYLVNIRELRSGNSISFKVYK